MYVGPVVEQELDDADPVVAGGKVERRGVAAVEVPAVDDVCVEVDDLLYELKVAGLGLGLSKCSLRIKPVKDDKFLGFHETTRGHLTLKCYKIKCF